MREYLRPALPNIYTNFYIYIHFSIKCDYQEIKGNFFKKNQKSVREC